MKLVKNNKIQYSIALTKEFVDITKSISHNAIAIIFYICTYAITDKSFIYDEKFVNDCKAKLNIRTTTIITAIDELIDKSIIVLDDNNCNLYTINPKYILGLKNKA